MNTDPRDALLAEAARRGCWATLPWSIDHVSRPGR